MVQIARWRVWVILGIHGLLLVPGERLPGADSVRQGVVEIEVEVGDWGKAPISNIRAVLQSAAGEIRSACGSVRLDPLRVYHRAEGPITEFRRALDGRIRVGLSSRDLYWAQYAFQFGHEFAHVLANHSNDWQGKWHEIHHDNHWLEEALAETASLYVLRAMSRSWQVRPPYPNWKSFAPKLAQYSADRMNESGHQKPDNQSFAQWFDGVHGDLRRTPGPSANSVILARELLPLFESEPSGWETLAWLNLGPRDVHQSLREYLAGWKDNCPENRRAFVQRLAGLFGIRL